MTGTDVARFTHNQFRSYLNHLVVIIACSFSHCHPWYKTYFFFHQSASCYDPGTFIHASITELSHKSWPVTHTACHNKLDINPCRECHVRRTGKSCVDGNKSELWAQCRQQQSKRYTSRKKCLYSLLAVRFKYGLCKSLCCASASSLLNVRFLLWLEHCPI